jgi:hypothetical protein
MTRKEAIATLKNRIKQLAADQKEDREITRQNHETYNAKYDAWREQLFAMGKYPHQVKSGGVRSLYDVWSSIGRRKAEITAALNLYLELRGKEYRHNVPEWYDADYAEWTASMRRAYAVVQEDCAH